MVALAAIKHRSLCEAEAASLLHSWNSCSSRVFLRRDPPCPEQLATFYRLIRIKRDWLSRISLQQVSKLLLHLLLQGALRMQLSGHIELALCCIMICCCTLQFAATGKVSIGGYGGPHIDDIANECHLEGWWGALRSSFSSCCQADRGMCGL